MNSDRSSSSRALVTNLWPSQLISPNELIDRDLKITKKFPSFIRSPFASRVVLQIVGAWSYLISTKFNSCTIYNREAFDKQVLHDDNDQHKRSPLLTISNHTSCLDDPILWGPLIPFNHYYYRPDHVRWSPAAHDICFTKQWHSHFFALGKTFPIQRGKGIYQPEMEFALALLRRNKWLHFFPEGQVMKDNEHIITERGYKFKWGIARLIIDYLGADNQTINDQSQPRSIRILPFYHVGMDQVLPLGQPYIPRIGKRITIQFRHEAIEMDEQKLQQILSEPLAATNGGETFHKFDAPAMKRIKLIRYLENEMDNVKNLALERHR